MSVHQRAQGPRFLAPDLAVILIVSLHDVFVRACVVDAFLLCQVFAVWMLQRKLWCLKEVQKFDESYKRQKGLSSLTNR